MSEFVAVEWFGRDVMIGIVLTYDEFDGFKARMAPLPNFIISDPESDTAWLMRHAAKIPFDWAWGIFGNRMLLEWQNYHLTLKSWAIVRYDGVDYDVETLRKVSS